MFTSIMPSHSSTFPCSNKGLGHAAGIVAEHINAFVRFGRAVDEALHLVALRHVCLDYRILHEESSLARTGSLSTRLAPSTSVRAEGCKAAASPSPLLAPMITA